MLNEQKGVDPNQKNKPIRWWLLALSLMLIFIGTFSYCNKESYLDDLTITDTTTSTVQDYVSNSNEIGTIDDDTDIDMDFIDDNIIYNPAPVRRQAMLQTYPLKRSIYLDGTDSIYNNVGGRNVFAKYCKDNGFDEVHFYKFSNITSNSANYPNFATFNKLLYDNGVTKRVAVLGSSSTTNFQNYWAYTTDTTKKPNGINLEHEWWNNVIPWSQWIMELTTLDSYADSKSPDLSNSFYMGWYSNMGGVTDSAAARAQLQETDWIDLHCYRANKLDYGYTKSRLEAIAKAASGRGKVANINIIVSTEQMAWGASNDFDGNYLKSLGYAGLEKKYIDDFNTNANATVKQWVRITKFKYFTKRYNYKAILPR